MIKFKLDLHRHMSDLFHFILSKQGKKEYLIKLLNKLFRKGDDLVIGLADFNNDGRFSKFEKTIRELPKDYLINKKGPIISIKKNKKMIYFIRANEISTEKGHILIIGNNEKIKTRKLENILIKAKENKWIVIADHPLHEFTFPYFLISRINEHSAISLKKETIYNNKKNIDVLELNSYFPEDRKEIKKLGKKYKIPVISESDAHFMNEFFNSYFELDNLDLTNITKFKKTFRKALKKHIKLHPRKKGIFVIYKHGVYVVMEIFGKKLGLIK